MFFSDSTKHFKFIIQPINNDGGQLLSVLVSPLSLLCHLLFIFVIWYSKIDEVSLIDLFICLQEEGGAYSEMDLKRMLHSCGVTGRLPCEKLLEVHRAIQSDSYRTDRPTLAHLLRAGLLAWQKMDRGMDVNTALTSSCFEVYVRGHKDISRKQVRIKVDHFVKHNVIVMMLTLVCRVLDVLLSHDNTYVESFGIGLRLMMSSKTCPVYNWRRKENNVEWRHRRDWLSCPLSSFVSVPYLLNYLSDCLHISRRSRCAFLV